MKKLMIIAAAALVLTACGEKKTQAANENVAPKTGLEAPMPTIQTEMAKGIAENQVCERMKAANTQQGLDCEAKLKEQREARDAAPKAQ